VISGHYVPSALIGLIVVKGFASFLTEKLARRGIMSAGSTVSIRSSVSRSAK
jgi:hypothetical protein